MVKRFFFLFILLGVLTNNVKSENEFYFQSTIFSQEDNYFLHTVERGQTVYSIAQMYHVAVDDIYKLNPDSRTGIQIGTQLRIPQKSGSYFYHTIQPKETLYSVSKRFEMKGEDIIAANPGLSPQTFTIGKIIRIPTNKVTTPMSGKNEDQEKKLTNALLEQLSKGRAVSTVKVALLLPFGLKEGTTPANVSTDVQRMVEYYEGFLIALSDLKAKKISVDLQVYDIGSGTAEVNSVLKKEYLKNVNLIIGGLSDKQIKLISDFSRNNNIPYVIPFTSKSDEPLNNPNVFQVNTPQSYLYSKAAAAFVKKYEKSNVIFLITNPSGDKMDFIQAAQAELKQRNLSWQTLTYSENLQADILSLMSDSKDNVIVPSDDSSESLSKLNAHLLVLKEYHPDWQVSLFGYQRWQVYGSLSDDYFKLNTNFYTVFFANPTSPEVKSFYSKFSHWYSRDLINSYPKYGILGYDTGMYFLQLIHQYGTSFTTKMNQFKYKGVQIDFSFERVNNWGGFINTNMYIVSYNPDYTITKSYVK